jgi:DNA-binding NarL/FixJ family response regulator
MYANQTTAYEPQMTVPRVLVSEGATLSRAPGRAVRVLVVDHHPVVQLGVRLFLAADEQVEVTGGASTAAEAVDMARRDRPDIALLEPNLPDMLLEELVEHLRASSPNTRLVVFAAHISPTIREQVTKLGIHGLVGQGSSAEEVIDVVARVAAGEVVGAPASEHLLRDVADKLHCTALTAWEHEILRHAARGASNSEIAAEIFLAPTTVKSYLQSALGKLGARNRAEAVFMLGELGLL